MAQLLLSLLPEGKSGGSGPTPSLAPTPPAPLVGIQWIPATWSQQQLGQVAALESRLAWGLHTGQDPPVGRRCPSHPRAFKQSGGWDTDTGLQSPWVLGCAGLWADADSEAHDPTAWVQGPGGSERAWALLVQQLRRRPNPQALTPAQPVSWIMLGFNY